MSNITLDIFTVKEVTEYIKQLITANSDLNDIWITGEISNFHHHNSGHMYLSLKDNKAKIDAVMFKNNNKKVKFKPVDGLKVNAHGYIDVYKPRGIYQLYIDRLEPVGKGSLFLAFEQLKKKLENEGLFSENNKKPIKVLPAKIGVVTSPTGAAIKDILSVARRRFENVSLLIVPSLVQGDNAAIQIVKGIEYLNVREDIDVIIITRGGGSIEDLWSFNEEVVARAIYNSKTPVISGVGHETDFTISDFVADLRAPTPSAAAEMAIANRLELKKNIENLQKRLQSLMKNSIVNKRNKVDSIAKKKIFTSPEELYTGHIQKLDELRTSMNYNIEKILTNVKNKFEILTGKMDTLSPLKTLNRGYSISKLKEGDIVSSIKNAKANDELITRVTDGIIISRISALKAGDGNGGK